MRAAAELSSMTTALEDVSRRVAAIAEDYEAAKRDDLAAELFEVERSVAAAIRRLTRVATAAARS
jgi:hypothetical protein